MGLGLGLGLGVRVRLGVRVGKLGFGLGLGLGWVQSAVPVALELRGHWLQGRGSWKELNRYQRIQAMMVL